jgi:UDP-N-acetyl-D-mannosaminuronate dehydrogenase
MLRDLRAFPKFVGADVDAAWFKAKRHFREIDLHPVQIRDSRATELAKLLDTTYYGVCIAYHEFANQLCRKEGVNFDDVMTKFNDTYNDTMAALGRENFIRPTLYPPEGPIGGHCVVPNARMLEEQYGAHDLLRPLKVGTTDD